MPVCQLLGGFPGAAVNSSFLGTAVSCLLRIKEGSAETTERESDLVTSFCNITVEHMWPAEALEADKHRLMLGF